MAVVLGTSSGFVTVTPVDDPAGTGVTIDGSSVVTKHTSPATAYRITEIGWYRASGTNTANWELALYADSAGAAGARLQWLSTNSTNQNGWLSVPVSWLISPNTAYWLGLQMDAHSGSSSVDSEAAGGAGSDVMTSQTTLNDPYGGGAVADADGMYAIYVLWVAAPAGASVAAFTGTFTTAGTVTEAARATSVARISLASASTPATRTAHSIKVRARTTTGSTGKINVALYEGATNRSGDLQQSDTLTNSLADYTLAISDANAANISSYSDLEIRLWGTNATGGLLTYEVDQLWLEIPAAAAGPTEWFGATVGPFTLTSTTSGTHPSAGASAAAFTGTFTTQGITSRFAASSEDFAATFTTQGTSSAGHQEWSGAATQDYAATLTTQGTAERFGSSVAPFTSTFTTQGLGSHFGVTSEDFSGTFTTQGSVQGAQSGAVVAPFTLSATTIGIVDAHAASSSSLTATFTTQGVTSRFGAVLDALTSTFTTQGFNTTAGASVSPYSATFTTAGKLEARGAIVDALTATFTTQGFKTTKGEVQPVFTATFTTQGQQSGQQFGASVAAFTGTLTTQGRDLWQRGATTQAFSGTFTTQGGLTVRASVVLPFTSTFTTQGTSGHIVSGASALPLTATFTTLGQPAIKIGQSVVTLSFAETTAGYTTTTGVIVLPLTAALTSAGYASMTAQAVLDFLLGLTSSGTRQAAQLTYLDVIFTGSLGRGYVGDIAEQGNNLGRIAESEKVGV